MKTTQIIAIVAIAAAIGVLVVVSGDYDSYQPFSHALDNPNKKVQIIGQLSTDKEIYYNPQKDPNYFSFYMKDDEGTEQKVVLKASKPQDFERSEKIVLKGKMNGEDFIASDMLMKCPSKYKDEEIRVKARM